MGNSVIEDNQFHGNDYTQKHLAKADYIDCSFSNCNFSNSDISQIIFIDCEFKDCDLSLTNLANTSLQNIFFKNCKLLGLHFDSCEELMFNVSFENCLLNLSSF